MTVQAMLAVLLSPSKLRYDAGRSLTKTKKIKAVLTGGLSIFLACLLFVGVQVFAVFWSSHKMVYASEQSFVYTAPAKMEPITTSIEVPQSAVDNVQIQSVVHAWAKKYQQKASVTILDTASGETLATYQSDKQYTTASIYKLYVAYVASQDIDSGLHDGNQLFLDTYSRFDCITRMIQFSDSPCAERMMNEMGKPYLQTKLNVLGLGGTSMARLTTTTDDAALITKKVSNGEGLSADSAARLQEAMNNQQYRTGLPAGFKNMQVGNKVGFYETGYHDTANVIPKSGHTFTVTVFTENMSSRNIAELAKLLQPIFEKS